MLLAACCAHDSLSTQTLEPADTEADELGIIAKDMGVLLSIDGMYEVEHGW